MSMLKSDVFQVSNAYVDPWDMTCAVASAGHALSRRKGRACPVPSQVQGMPCPVANAEHALSRCKFRDTVDLIKLPPGLLTPTLHSVELYSSPVFSR